MGEWVDENWSWVFRWSRRFFEWEFVMSEDVMLALSDRNVSSEEDRWVWSLSDDDRFSVKSAYTMLAPILLNETNEEFVDSSVVKNIWKSAVPSKVAAFAWKMSHDQFPTKSNLACRFIIAPGLSGDCVLCE
jgi:hypothetical protein